MTDSATFAIPEAGDEGEIILRINAKREIITGDTLVELTLSAGVN